MSNVDLFCFFWITPKYHLGSLDWLLLIDHGDLKPLASRFPDVLWWSRFAASTNKSYAVGCPVPRSPHNDEVEGKRQINPPWIRSSEIPFALYGSRCMLGFKRRFFLTMAFVSSMLFPQQSDCASGPKLTLVPPGKRESVADTLLGTTVWDDYRWAGATRRSEGQGPRRRLKTRGRKVFGCLAWSA